MSAGLVLYEGAPAPLARLERAVQALAEARTLDEVTHIEALAEAAAAYARAEKLGVEAIRYANAIRVRAAARAGEMLAQMEKQHGARGLGKKVEFPSGHSAPPMLKEIGYTAKRSSRNQAIWAVQREAPGLFEELIRDGVAPSKVAVALAAVKAPEPPEPEAERRLADCRRLCGELLALGKPGEVAQEMARDKAMVKVVMRLAAWSRLCYAASVSPAAEGDISPGRPRRQRRLSLGDVLERFGRLDVQAEADPISAWLFKVACALDGPAQ
jgi:hypothetical protein